VLKNFND